VENLADPIIVGRGEVGQQKFFAEIPDSRFTDDTYHGAASWMGFQFLEILVTETTLLGDSRQEPPVDGTLMLKYVPRTGERAEAEACQVTFTPIATPDGGMAEASDWNDRIPPCNTGRAPTIYHVVNALTELPVWDHAGPRSREPTAESLIAIREY
jgi:hypothetical protein